MGNLNKIPNIWLVYKSNRKNSKVKMKKIVDTRIDDVIADNRHFSYVPDNTKIVDIGVGDGFEQIFKKKYKL
jgi:hypothetical protein